MIQSKKTHRWGWWALVGLAVPIALALKASRPSDEDSETCPCGCS